MRYIKTARVIVNPISGRGHAVRIVPYLARTLERIRVRMELVPTEGKGHARRVASELTPHHKLLIIVGGDGTINEAVNGLQDPSSVEIGIIPVGTGNVLCKELSIPRNLKKACDLLEIGKVRRIDLGIFGTDRFVSVAGAGLDAQIISRLHSFRNSPVPMRNYILPTARTILKYDYPRICVEVDGRIVEENATFVLVSNVRSYGGPMILNPYPLPDDGFLDVAAFTCRNMREIVRGLVTAFFRQPQRYSTSRYFRGRKVRLISNGYVPLQIDGAPAGTIPMDFGIIPGALSVIVP